VLVQEGADLEVEVTVEALLDLLAAEAFLRGEKVALHVKEVSLHDAEPLHHEEEV